MAVVAKLCLVRLQLPAIPCCAYACHVLVAEGSQLLSTDQCASFASQATSSTSSSCLHGAPAPAGAAAATPQHSIQRLARHEHAVMPRTASVLWILALSKVRHFTACPVLSACRKVHSGAPVLPAIHVHKDHSRTSNSSLAVCCAGHWKNCHAQSNDCSASACQLGNLKLGVHATPLRLLPLVYQAGQPGPAVPMARRTRMLIKHAQKVHTFSNAQGDRPVARHCEHPRQPYCRTCNLSHKAKPELFLV